MKTMKFRFNGYDYWFTGLAYYKQVVDSCVKEKITKLEYDKMLGLFMLS